MKNLPVDAGEGRRRDVREDNPESKPSPSIKKDLSGEYKRFVMQNSSNKFHKDIAIAKDPHSHSHGPEYGSHSHYHTLNAPSLSMQYEASYRPNQEASNRTN